MRAVIVAGARPNFMKVAPLLCRLKESDHEAVLVHTGQHYDQSMSDAFFADLALPAPDFHLGVGSGSHAQQTARIMEAFEPVLLSVRPTWVVVVGDVNSTLACALVTAKLRSELGCRIAHVEAGLRSRDWRMPEEVNRVLTDQLSDLLLTPSHDADENLAREGIAAAKVAFVGNIMIDTLYAQLPYAERMGMPATLGFRPGGYVAATVHRPSNVDDPRSLSGILQALQRVSAELPVALPLHPRARRQIQSFGLSDLLDGLVVLDPLGYRQMLSLTHGAAAVLTDSGGLQEESTVLGVPCVTLREQTERPVTIEHGTNQLAPWPLSVEGIYGAYRDAVRRGRLAVGERVPEGWDGKAAQRVVQELERATAPQSCTLPAGTLVRSH